MFFLYACSIFCEKIRQIQHDLNDIERVDLKSLSRSFRDSDFDGMIRVKLLCMKKNSSFFPCQITFYYVPGNSTLTLLHLICN